jgi:potassium-transporting ATPase KdpC subunit
MLKTLRPALVLFLLLTVVTGILYPLVVTAVAQAAFPAQANGSLIEINGQAAGSELIGQPFDAPGYFWSRPSAANYDASASSGSNLGPNNPALVEAVQARIAALQAADPANTASIPADLVTTSGSGLDPHISLAAATYQIPRVARARGMDEAALQALVDRYTEARQFFFLGEPVVNVLRLNLALDGLQ